MKIYHPQFKMLPNFSRKSIALSLGLLLSAVSASPAHSLDLLEAYDSAVANSFDLRGSIANKEATILQTEAAQGQLLPQLSGSLGAGQTFGDFGQFGSSDFSTDYGINVTQAIYNPAIQAQIRIAKLNELSGELAVESTKMQLIFDVAETYLEVLNVQERIESNKAQIAFLTSQLNTVRAQFDVGLVTSADVLQVQAQLDIAEATLSANQANLNSALGDFYRVTKQTENPSLNPNSSKDLPTIKPDDINYWLMTGRNNNLQIEQADIDFRSADAQIDSAKASQLPTLNLSAGYGGEIDDGFNNDNGQIGLNFNIPLYTGGSNEANTKAAAFNRESARFSKASIVDEVEQAIRSQFLNLDAQYDQVIALSRAIQSNRVARESIQAGYEIGTQTIAELLNAESTLRQSETDFILARQQYLLSLVAIKQTVGVLVASDLNQINSALY